MTDQDSLIQEFASITGQPQSTARFHLESAEWDLDTALETYFEQQTGPKIATLEQKKTQPNTYYAGGEKSGVAIQGPPNIVKDILNKAKEENEKSEAKCLLKFWSNGFTINDQFYSYDDDEGTQILHALQQGRAPVGLMNVKMGQSVDCQVVHCDENYVPKFKPFQSKPNTLSTKPKIEIDEQKPISRIQVRLHNGQRQVVVLNQSHTVEDLYLLIREITPVEFDLLVNGKEIKSIKEVNNCCVNQILK